MSTAKTPVDYAIKAALDLEETVENLAQCLVQGVDRPLRAAGFDAVKKHERDEEARLERLQRTDIAPGESALPFDPDIAEKLLEVLAGAEMLADEVAIAMTACLIPVRSRLADPRPYIRFLIAQLPAAEVAQPGLSSRVQDRARDLVDGAAEVLGLVVDGQELKAVCPWCNGRTDTHPIGGAYTLRIRNYLGFDSPLVVCEGGHCEPPEADCGQWVRGRPAWLQSEWEWLADRIDRTTREAS